ncbi:hypothetical protein [Echinimonas agarilytica]|uniref:Chemotaxis protein n=1 Tax=Echinimonas agarilytica TaxID=1215918 RepID=A0AA41W415_9GAMM|nr:hypothetical protein [Echinimonas agarilytica]MCM2678435.1 hypothetical protein [Echinimonas agarilytica]
MMLDLGRLLRTMVLACLGLMMSACSLLSIDIETNTVPLSQQEVNTRAMTRDFVSVYDLATEDAADQIYHLADGHAQIQTNTLFWKLNGQAAIHKGAYQTNPEVALLDVWLFIEQQIDFFETGAGRTAFGPHQHIALDVLNSMHSKVIEVAKTNSKPDVFSSAQGFVDAHKAQHVLVDFSFRRSRFYEAWLEYQNVDLAELRINEGTLPQVVGDFSDRIYSATTQVPKSLEWRSQILAQQAGPQVQRLETISQNLNATSARILDMIQNNDKYMADLAVTIKHELTPLLNELDEQASQAVIALGREREELGLLIAKEREALGQLMTQQSERFSADLEVTGNHLIDNTMTQLEALVKSLIVYLIIFLAALCLLFVGAFYWGHRTATKAILLAQKG